LVSGSSQIDLTGTTNYSTGIKTRLNAENVISGSAQVLNGSGIWSGSAQLPSGVVSGSSQISYPSLSNIPSGVVSGSVQIDLPSTTNYSSGIKTRLNAEGVISGSSQVTGISNSQLTNSSFHIGTTSISLGRTSASQTLTGVSIDGNAVTVTNGVYTTGNQTIVGIKTFTDDIRLFKNHLNGNTATWTSNIIFTDEVDRLGARIVGERTAWDGAPMGLGFDTGGVGTVTRRMTITSGGNIGVGVASSLSSKFTVYKGTQSNTVSVANSAAFIYGADIGLAIGQDSGTAGYGTWLQSMQTGGNSFPMTINPNGGNVIIGSLTTSSYKFSVFGGQYGTYLRGGDLGTGSDILRLVDSAGNTKYLARGDGKHYFEGDTVVNGGDIKFNPGTGNLGNRYLYINKGTSNDGGILLSRDNAMDWQIVNATSTGDLWFYSYGVGHTVLGMERATGNMVYRGNIVPQSNGNYNLGSSSLRWNTVFTSDLSLSNGIGDYTIVEGENDLFLYNNKQNKVYKFMLQEVNPNDATPKRPE
jgi:hypothetical protein